MKKLGTASLVETVEDLDGLLKNARLLRFPHPSSLRRTSKYVLLLRISRAPASGIS